MVSLSEEQLQVCNLANDFNIFITGRAGCGKSVVVRHIVANLQEKFGEQEVAVVAPTGKAALLINGTTVHSFFRLGLGQKDANDIYKQLRGDDETFKRLRNLKVLVCDEISMLSGSILGKVDCLLQSVKENCHPFGGIRVVFAGDFFQLPPVDIREDYTPDYCFMNDTWQKGIDMCIFLSGVYRQDNARFIEMLENLRMGRRTANCLDLVNKLTRPLSQVDIRLYSLRQDVEVYNQKHIDMIEGHEKRYIAQDMGIEKAKLNKLCQAPSVLCTKIGAPVMLLQNLFSISPCLVNGLAGVVTAFSGGNPVITFNTGETHTIERHMFGFYNNEKLIAARLQYPLQLGFSVTVHKSQGSTLNNVEIVDLHMFAPGQQYTAYTRAATPETFRVVPGYNAHVHQPHPHVLHFYNTQVRVLKNVVLPTISKSAMPLPSAAEDTGTSVPDPRPSDDVHFPPIPMPEGYDCAAIMRLLMEDLSPFEHLSSVGRQLDGDEIQSYLGYLIGKVEDMFTDKTNEGGKEVMSRKAFTSHISKLLAVTAETETKARWTTTHNISCTKTAETILTRLIMP
ncbi:ATP-dependent DNA helicase Pif1-like [Branchiostoma floridae x Branchiostoma japonicum]